jgi:hypothetical protein
MHDLLSHNVGCGVWVKDTVMDEGVIYSESNIERCGLPIPLSNVSHLVNKRRIFFKKVIFHKFVVGKLKPLHPCVSQRCFERVPLSQEVRSLGRKRKYLVC